MYIYDRNEKNNWWNILKINEEEKDNTSNKNFCDLIQEMRFNDISIDFNKNNMLIPELMEFLHGKE